MGNLLNSILNSAGAIQVYNRQLAVIQNNISNANTPGFVKQTQELEAMSLNLSQGLTGGVAAGPVVSSRSGYAEQTVRTQLSHLGTAEQKAGDLAGVTPLFDPTSDSGIAGSLTKFFNSFSQLSVKPNDGLARQAVLSSAQAVADSFHQTASGLATAGQEADTEVHNLTATINRLAADVREVNSSYRQNFESTSDAGLDAKLHSSLEQLSEVADFTVNREADGAVSVYLGGQTPLVIGDRQFQVSADSSKPQTAVLDSAGRDVTSEIHNGQLAGALDEQNRLIPSYLADLDNLAKNLSDQVNTQLAAGVDVSGSPPGNNLFAYNPAAAAATMQVTAITPDQVAAAAPGAPGGNANALTVAGMLKTKTMGGSTFTEYYGTLGGRIGRDLATAQSDQTTRKGLVDQARNLRQQMSGVSLDEEAAHLLQVQRAYQASGKLMSVLNDIMDTLMQTFR